MIAGTYPEEKDFSIIKKQLIRVIHKTEDLLKKVKLKKIYSWFYNQRVNFLYSKLHLSNLYFVGKLDNVVSIIALCDGLIFAGCTPHFPRPVYEAWALKKPVIVFNIEGVSNNISENIDGVITKSNDAIGLAKAIKNVDVSMGKYGYKKSLKKFDMNKNIKDIIEIYRTIK